MSLALNLRWTLNWIWLFMNFLHLQWKGTENVQYIVKYWHLISLTGNCWFFLLLFRFRIRSCSWVLYIFRPFCVLCLALHVSFHGSLSWLVWIAFWADPLFYFCLHGGAVEVKRDDFKLFCRCRDEGVDQPVLQRGKPILLWVISDNIWLNCTLASDCVSHYSWSWQEPFGEAFGLQALYNLEWISWLLNMFGDPFCIHLTQFTRHIYYHCLCINLVSINHCVWPDIC